MTPLGVSTLVLDGDAPPLGGEWAGETPPSCPHPCLACAAWSRDWVDTLDAFDLLYACASTLDVPLVVIPCEAHGDHVRLGRATARVAQCRGCLDEVVILHGDEGIEDEIVEWAPGERTVRVLARGIA